ncbi:imelysin family protein [Chitinibacter sp. GC72]|uniref:imelysin family protein n=1 Tax=Chitinibacter sp. GC72 TaxID=1526917 RepID=UPI0012FC0675|nr:imelysin family protein [Chitinibacter sp. GC72]
MSKWMNKWVCKPLTVGPLSVALLAAGVAMTAQADGGADASDASAVEAVKRISAMDFTRSQLNDILLPAHQQLAQASAALSTASRAFCAAPATGTFAAMQAQYVNTLLAWRTIEIAPLGPSAEPEVGRVMEGQAQSPAQILTLIPLQTSKDMVDGQAAFEATKLPAWGIGFKAIESLLYTDKPTQSIERLRPAAACSYLVWQTQVVAYQAETLRRAWQGLSRGVAYDMSYPRTYQTQLFNRMIEGARDLEHKVGLHQPQWLDQRAGATVPALKANVAGLRALLTGEPRAIGLDDFMLSREDQPRWTLIDNALKALEAALPANDKALSNAQARQIVVAANRLADVLEKDLAPAMSIKIGKVKR